MHPIDLFFLDHMHSYVELHVPDSENFHVYVQDSENWSNDGSNSKFSWRRFVCFDLEDTCRVHRFSPGRF